MIIDYAFAGSEIFSLHELHVCLLALSLGFRYDVMMSCWEKDPDERPTFAELTERLERIIQEDVPYMKMNSETGILMENKQKGTNVNNERGTFV